MATESMTLITRVDVVRAASILPNSSVLVSGSRIVAVGKPASQAARRSSVQRLDGRGGYLSAGFVDLHTHGVVGVDLVRADEAEFSRAMQFYLSCGVTSILASVYPQPWSQLLKCVRRLARFVEEGIGNGVAVGLHLEGPYLSSKRPGALPAKHFRRYAAGDLDALLEAGGGMVRTMTLAPEIAGSSRLIDRLRRHGVVPAFGHSDADYQGTRACLARGVSYATHLFNAMNGVHHRSPGAVMALLEDRDTAVELIADGHHVDVPLLRLVEREKRADKILLVSDSVQPCGLKPGRCSFAGRSGYARGGRVTLADGTLAGSLLTLPEAVRRWVQEVGAPPAAAFAAATRNPARAIGLRRGELVKGRPADLTLLDKDFRVQATWLGGRLAFRRRRG